MKILVIPSAYPDEADPVSGIFVRDHLNAASLFHEVTVFYPRPQAFRSLPRFCTISDQIEQDLRTIRVKFQRPPSLRAIQKTWILNYMLAALWSASSLWKTMQPDLIHAHCCFPAGFLAVLLGQRYNIPVVITQHSGPFSKFMKSVALATIARYALSRATTIVPVSRALQSEMKNYGIGGRFVVVPNPVASECFSQVCRARPQDSRKRMLFVAMLSDHKGLQYCLQAMAALRRKGRTDFLLDVVGDGPYRETLERQAAELRLNGLVCFHGVKPRTEVFRFMRACDFLVHPSLNESFGCVIVEAMACGKPVLATRCGGPEDTIVSHTGILVNPANAEQLTGGLEYMLDHLHQYDPEIIAGYTRRRFSCRTVGQTLDRIFSEAALAYVRNRRLA